MQQANKENLESRAVSSDDRIRKSELGIQEIELLELYWEDFCELEWHGNEGYSSRKPSLDDYDRWAR